MRNTVPKRLTPQIRKTSIPALSIIILLTLSLGVAHAWTTTTSTSFSGRAIGVSVTAPLVGTLTLADTGPLPSQGGELDATVLTVSTAYAQADVLLSVTTGFDQTARSEAAVADVTLLPGTSNQVTADFVRSQAVATCSGVSGSSDLVNLQVSGQTITVSGQPNQQVSVPGVLTLVINEQIVSSGGGTNSITVNALDLTTIGGIRVIVSSAHSDITCVTPPPPVQKNFMTGGGFIVVNGYHANFGFVAGFKPGKSAPSGQLTYTDHGKGMKAKATSIDTYAPSGNTGTTRTFTGQAEVNGVSGYSFTVTATDNGEPGKGNDYFSITLTNPSGFYYHAQDSLGGGNIQLHA